MTKAQMQDVIKEALEKEHNLDERCITSYEWLEIFAYLDDCFEAEEKQIPKMVIYTADGYADGQLVYDMAECPNCGTHYEEADQLWETEHCLKCGQALKWEVEE